MESGRFRPLKSLMVKPPMRIGRDASTTELSVIAPASSPMARVKLLKVEPISKVALLMRLNQPFSYSLSMLPSARVREGSFGS
ncbi:hypothetical protein D3C72_2271460 [compost metagenome]